MAETKPGCAIARSPQMEDNARNIPRSGHERLWRFSRLRIKPAWRTCKQHKPMRREACWWWVGWLSNMVIDVYAVISLFANCYRILRHGWHATLHESNRPSSIPITDEPTWCWKSHLVSSVQHHEKFQDDRGRQWATVYERHYTLRVPDHSHGFSLWLMRKVSKDAFSRSSTSCF